MEKQSQKKKKKDPDEDFVIEKYGIKQSEYK